VSTALLDASTLESLRRLDRDGGLLPRLAAAFERTAAQFLPALQADAHDWPQLQRAAHTLGSAGLQLGAFNLAQHCQQLEAAVQAGHVHQTDTLRAAMPQLLSETLQQLRAT
jgi:HPt (histidine-containing phosphotransfer) domain-containing protein